MKMRLIYKFWILFAVLAAASFILISTLGAYLVESTLKNYNSRNMYNEAKTIISHILDNKKSLNSEDIYNNLSAIASYQNTGIILIDTTGAVIMDTDKPFSAKPVIIEGFDPAVSGSNRYYMTGNFFGYYDEEVLTVLLPVAGDLRIQGYLAVNMPLSAVLSQRELFVGAMHIIAIIIFIFSFIIILLIIIWVSRPLNRIIEGSKEFASGNLKHRILIGSNDELQYLSETLNYMAGEMDRAAEGQHDFIANISHDFRTPLTSIKGYVEAIKDGTIPYEMQGKYLDIVLTETARLNKLTKELLTLDKMDFKQRSMNMEVFNINQCIKDTVNTFEGICEKNNIVLSLILEGEVLNVFADRGKIQQVIYNLIDNAIKFSNTGSVIEIETTERHDKVYVSIKDHGIGISKNDLQNIWKRFYKIDTSRGKDRSGTGLGLSIVREIIQAHDQKINVVSTENAGTEFTFTLQSAHAESNRES